MSLPNPGSPAARSFGCACPPTTNRDGEGAYVDGKGVTRFVVAFSCKVHKKGWNDSQALTAVSAGGSL